VPSACYVTGPSVSTFMSRRSCRDVHNCRICLDKIKAARFADRAGHAALERRSRRARKLLTLESTPRSSVPGMSSTAAIEPDLRVGQLAEAVGATSDTIRYYERAGLLPPPRRTPAGYRAYDVLAVDRLRFIQGAQRLGLRLADIRDLLSVRDTGSCACGPAEDLLAQRLAEVDAEIARLSALRHEMLAMLDGLTGADCPPPAPGTWFPPSQGEVKPMALDVIDTCCDDCPPEACSSGCC
jgi:DNA-binding transcriptional MerR regulator